jgi:C-terminal processing protease CtpA/Prc
MWPALAGVGSLLGNGTAGSFVDAAGRATPWGYQDGRAWLDGQTVEEVDAPFELASSTSLVAVLTDIGVASSGEAIAIAFRGRPNARSFGSATCGLSTAVRQFPLANRARLAVVVSVMADRRARQYGGMVEPDESIADPTQVVERAVAWLRQR